MHCITLSLILAAAAMAQTPPAPPNSNPAPPTASVSGVVRDAGTGALLPDVAVSASKAASKTVEAITDAQGRYALRDLPAGQVRITAVGPSETRGSAPRMTKLVTLSAGQELAGIDFVIRGNAEISGKVLDQNKEPVPGLSVRLIAREYSLGALRYVFASAAQTDDQGEYTMKRIEPGRAYLLLAQKASHKLDPISESPVNPKLRKAAVVPTFYPGTSLEGAQALILSPSERREGVDLRVIRTPSYCIDGVVKSGSGPQALVFEIAERQPTSGASGNGAMFISAPGGVTDPDGKIRICDLHPGDYTITAFSQPADPVPAFFGIAAVSIVDEDVNKLFVAARPRMSVPGEVVWDGTPPDPPVSSSLSVYVHPMTRAPFPGEITISRPSIPGQFSIDNLFMDEYELRVSGVPAGAYLKDVTYDGHSVLREPLRLGTAVGEASLRIVLARDGGSISAKVADKDNNPVADAYVVVIPSSSSSDAMLAAAMLSGQTDQTGAWSSAVLPPGKYHVIASQLPVDKSPECIGKLQRSRNKAEEVEIGRGATVQVTLSPTRTD